MKKIPAYIWMMYLLAAFFNPQVLAHELQPALLEIQQEEGSTEIVVTWKVSTVGTNPVQLKPMISGFDLDMSTARISSTGSTTTRQWILDGSETGIWGREILIDGLQLVFTDVIVHIQLGNESPEMVVLRANQNRMVIGEERKTGAAIMEYIKLGIEHIMLGIDHLLFVLGLLLLSRSKWMLIKTITAFTVGHSISLALATLGVLNVPTKPLTAVIALSIVFLAMELVRYEHGRTSLTIRNPWVVSFGFGIIHGLGFAGGLMALGLPRSEIPLALLFFNIGVEIGQLIFILVVLMVMYSLRKMEWVTPRWSRPVPAYAIGTLAMFWFIGRFLIMF
jgi:hypothetical protein